MESAGPKERHTLRVLRRHKTTELNYNHRVTTASSAQYTQTTERRQCRGEAQKKKREAEIEIERRTTQFAGKYTYNGYR